MRNNNFVYTYLFTLLGGVLLMILHDRAQIFEAISIILGVAFLVIGTLSLLSSLFIGEKARAAGVRRSPVLVIVSSASFILGLLMVIAPKFFVEYVIYTFGIIMILAGLIQLCNFAPKMRGIGFKWYFLIVPCLCLLAGIVVFSVGAQNIANSMALLTGIVLTIYSINGFIGYFQRRSLLKIYEDKINPSREIINVK
ncbi:MAG: DUF308 domain-containing protein [Prevotella sp.]|nr:DUF308 domain-containing protein [Prevotella sp.]MCM1074309.1 DUF308 domain-containing protein [Ruminococcus sp.]